MLQHQAQQWVDRVEALRRGQPPKPRPVPRIDSTSPASLTRVVTFGELMLRLSPPDHRRIVQADRFDATFGGAEANVAVSLAQLGLPTALVTAVPENALGQAAVNQLRSLGVDTRYVLRGGDRLGLYYLEAGAAQRSSRVVYDRAASAFAQLDGEQIDWPAVMAQVKWFHWTGITAALGESVRQSLGAALEAARAAGVMVSCDLNYRRLLWSSQQAGEVMTPLMAYVDLVIANETDAADVFGLAVPGVDPAGGRANLTAYGELTCRLAEHCGVARAAVTVRESVSASRNRWAAVLFNGSEVLLSRRYEIEVVDRVGAGDAFAAGLIFGLLRGDSDRAALEFAVAASCLKHAMPGDFNLATVEEIEKLCGGQAHGLIQR